LPQSSNRRLFDIASPGFGHPVSRISMSSDAHPADNSEARDLKVFVALVLLVVVIGVLTGVTFGLGGIGALAIAASGAMLLLLVVLTAG